MHLMRALSGASNGLRFPGLKSEAIEAGSLRRRPNVPLYESPIGPSATTPCHGRRNLRRVERAVLRWLRGAVVRSVALPQGKACNNVDLLGQPTGYRWRFP